MLKFFKLLLAPFIFFIIPANPGLAFEDEILGAPCVVDAYLRAHEQTMQADADGEDIEAIMAFIAPDLVYEHPRVGIKIEGAEAYQAGLTAFLGATDGGRYEVMDYLVNGDTVAITFNRHFKTLSEGEWQDRSVEQLVVFEVQGGKITRIIDYW